ncbi:MAG: hypothetical protein AUJ39_00120 [Parcubacteria group bacterium CG1_02_42_13]|nr:MAG: hypothetical protein AUJ39_00120 [Parcubacteria group bacterium CG1_02_42_13]
MNRKILILIFLVFVFGALAGVATNPPRVSAGFLQDLFNRFIPGIFSPGEQAPAPDNNTPGTQTISPVALYAPTIDYEEAVINAVDEGSKSVVSIVISKYLPVIEQCPYDPFSNLPPEMKQFFGGGFEFSQPCQKGTKLEKVGGGSGFIVSSDGLILTNKHVVVDTKAEYTVITHDGNKYEAKVLARDPVQDLAIIKINATGLKPAKLGNSDSIKLGQTAIAIGYSLGEFSNTVSVGVISGLSRTITASGAGIGTETIQGVIQTDAAINPGNSGGPLLNLKGEVIGVNTAVASGAENVGFAIPINQAKKDIQSVKTSGTIKVPYLGVRYLVITPELAANEKLPVNEGALIKASDENAAVLSNSPAAKAGVKAGDIIMEINGEKLTTDKPLGNVIQKYNIGDVLTLKTRRGDAVLELYATLEERPGL